MATLVLLWLGCIHYLIFFAEAIQKRVCQAGNELHRARTVNHQEALIHILIGIQITQTYFFSYPHPSPVSQVSCGHQARLIHVLRKVSEDRVMSVEPMSKRIDHGTRPMYWFAVTGGVLVRCGTNR